tara:strand:- start:200 stop:1360 length:1161 start_codon:yes stop_codon:yes gene_type:complete
LAVNNPSLAEMSKTTVALPRRTAGWIRARWGVLVFILLPTLMAIAYFGFIAADLYASEARIVVRSPSQTPSLGVASFLQGGSMSRGENDIYSVHDFMLSRDAIAALREKINLREVFSREEADYFSAYPNLIYPDNEEDFYRYYQKRVEVIFDTTTGISKVTVKAFRPEDAQAVATHLLAAAEDMVNRLNDRSRTATVKDAEIQVKLAEQHVAEAENALLAYRNRETLIDPSKTSTAMFEQLSRMQTELTESRMRLAQMERAAPDSPFRAELKQNIRSLEQQIARQRGGLAGSKGSMAPKIAEFGQLSLRQEFAAKELTSALASMEAARAEARHQQIYLERVVEAGLPDRALYPKRFKSIMVVFVSCFLIYSIGLLLATGVREHGQD